MKKLISMILTLALIFSSVGGAYTAAYASDGDLSERYAAAPALTADAPADVSYDGTEASGALRFTPERDGVYIFSSEGEYDTYVDLYDGNGGYLGSDDDSGESNNFRLRSVLEAGKTYFLLTRRYSSESIAEYTVYVISYADLPALTAGVPVDVSYDGTEASGGFLFTPERDGTYAFFSMEGDDTFASLYDSGDTLIGENDDGGEDGNFCLRITLEAGKPYFLLTRDNGSQTNGQYKVCVVSYMDTPALTADAPAHVSYDGTEISGALRFIPERDGVYAFSSAGEYDTYASLYDSDFHHISDNDDGGEISNFCLKSVLKAGKTYFLLTKRLNGKPAEYTVSVTKEKDITALSLALISPDAALTFGRGGYWTDYYDETGGTNKTYYCFDRSTILDILTITATYEDGSTRAMEFDERLLSMKADQWTWTAGGTDNTVTITAGAVSASVSIPIVDPAALYADAPALTADEPFDVSYDGTAASGALRFTPERDGTYTFFSTGEYDTYIDLYDGSGGYLGSDDDNGKNSNFRLRAVLEAGKTYILLTRRYSSGSSAEYEVCAMEEKVITALSLALVSPDAALTIGKDDGYWNDYYDDSTGADIEYFCFYDTTICSILTITATYEDGSSRAVEYDTTTMSGHADQWTWTAGGTNNLFTVTAGDVSASIHVPVADMLSLYPDAPALAPGSPVTVDYSYSGEYGMPLKFTPAESGTYYFYSTGDADPVGRLFDVAGRRLGDVDDSGTSLNFLIGRELEAGKTYLLFVKTYDDREDSFGVAVSRARPDFLVAGYESLAGLDLSGKMINLVLAVDTTGSMGWVIEKVRTTLQDFVTALSGTHAELRISLIDYKDIVEDGAASTVLHYNARDGIWFENYDIEDLLAQIGQLDADGGGDTPESVLDVLGNAVEREVMTFNSDAARFAFLLTDADYKNENTHGIADMEELIKRLNEFGVATSVITTKDYFRDYRSLAYGTGGILINLRGDFESGMSAFAASIAANTASYVHDDTIIPVSGITLGEDLTIPVGKIRSFAATITPFNATDPRVVWSVEDETVARINDATTSHLLVVQGITEGTTKVIARSMDGGYVASFDLTTLPMVNTENQLESCDIDSLIEKIGELKAAAGSTEMIYYNDNAEQEFVPAEKQLEVFTSIADTGLSITFVYSDDYGDTRYQWKFDGVDITSPDIPVNMEISVGDEGSPAAEAAGEIMDPDQFEAIDFSHDGDLPGTAEVTVAVDLPDGTYILYYYDPETRLFQNAGAATVTGGMATFRISHCSSYVLAAESACIYGHDIIRVPARPATEKTNGNIEHWTCSNCGKCFSDADGKNEIPAESVVVTFTVDPSKAFSDIPKKAWYYSAVSYVVNHGIFAGANGRFDPNGDMTRAMFVSVLSRMAGVTLKNNVKTVFADVKSGQWYTGAVKWASGNDIVAGADGKFMPNDPITREQICTILVTYAKHMKITLKPKQAAVTFKDAKDISKWARSAVTACQRAGLVAGANGNFNPKGKATRAEVAQILTQFDKNFG